MAHEEQIKKYSTGNGSGDADISIRHLSRSSRKQKQKKVPQRGLGVAQLEKIRLEEQQKQDVSINSPSPAYISQNKPSNLSLPIPNYESLSIAIPHPLDISSPNSIFTPHNIELINSNTTISMANYVEWQTAAVQGQKHVPKVGNSSYYNLQKENCGVDPGHAFRSSLNLPCESIIWPFPSLIQRAEQHTQHSSSCSMVNASSGSSSSSLLDFQMEPPSNQSYYDNYTYNSPVWIQEEKMVGMKRPHPFSLENTPCYSFHHKCSTTSFDNGAMYNLSSSNPNCRQGSSCSTPILEPPSKKSIEENWACNGGFLTLAPPATTLTSTDFKLKSSAYLSFHNFEAFNFDSLPYQGNVEDQNLQQPEPMASNQQQTCYCFLPPALMQIGQTTKTINDCTGGEVGEKVDLNLKL